jgi:hypothetical protein
MIAVSLQRGASANAHAAVATDARALSRPG